jgi:predicted Fe-Mo cluster-binding NifX family protein
MPVAVTVAVPVCQQRISPVLDAAARLLLVTRKRGKETGRREFILDAQPPEALAGSIAELSVDVLLCAAVSEPLLRELERRGVRVRPHLCGDVEEILNAYCQHRLGRNDFRMPGCWERVHAPSPASKPSSQEKPWPQTT